MIGVMEARRQLDDTDFLSSLVGVRVPLHLPWITFGFSWRHNVPLRCFLFSVLLVCEDRLISCF